MHRRAKSPSWVVAGGKAFRQRILIDLAMFRQRLEDGQRHDCVVGEEPGRSR